MSKWHGDYDYRDYSYRKGSGSSSWMSKLSSSSSTTTGWWRREERDTNSNLQDLLNQLQNSANIIGGDESHRVSVRWSNGMNVNGADTGDGTHRVYLSPDRLVSGGEVSEEVLDAMTGKVYLASTLRETVSPEAYRVANGFRGCKDSVSKNSVGLWESLETSIARSTILENWAGFAPYVAEDAKRSSADKAKVQEFIDASSVKPSLDAVTAAVAWNLLNPKDQVEIPSCYDECVKAASEIMDQEVSADERFDSCHQIVDRMNEILKTNEQDQDGEGEGEGDSSDEQKEGDGGGKSEGKSKPSDSKGKGEPSKSPSLCDSSLLGSVVENKTDASLAEQQAEETSKNDDGPEIRAEAKDGMCDLGKKHRVKKVVATGCEGSYRDIVTSHRREIANIRSSLMFRNSVNRMVSYGHRSGDIDENSLFKISMDDDRVMTKTDIVAAKKIAICLLIDESGSMGANNDYGTYYEQARNVAIILAEGLRGVEGIDVSIYGHTAEDGFRGVTLTEYYSPRQKNLASLMQVDARMENHDSWAILHTANIFRRDYAEHDRKIMFVISDGEPAGSSYGGPSARRHMLEVNNACRLRGVEVYGVGIANAFPQSLGDQMYGENRCVILKDIRSSLGIMGRFIRQIAIKQGAR